MFLISHWRFILWFLLGWVVLSFALVPFYARIVRKIK